MGIGITFRSLSQWPAKPTPPSQRRRSTFSASWSKTVDLLESELQRLNARNVVIEADCDPSEVRIDGQLRANAKLRGPGVVVSFECSKGALRFPCDTFTDWQANVRGIALSLEALRTVDRYGVTQRAEQYKGWTALPDISVEKRTAKEAAAEWMVKQCHALHAIEPPTRREVIHDEEMRRATYKYLAKELHPDRRGGDESLFKDLQNHMKAFE